MISAKNQIRTIAACLLLTAIWLACGGGNGPGYDVAGNLAKAWDYFEDEDYDGALAKFIEVIDNTTGGTARLAAYVGKGWCYAFELEYTPAVAAFDTSLQYDTTADALMGLAAVCRDLPNYQAAVNYATLLIAADSDYVFAHRPSINFADAHLIKAQAYFHLGATYFPNAHSEVNYLCELADIEPLPDPETLPADEYELALAAKLEELGEILIE